MSLLHAEEKRAYQWINALFNPKIPLPIGESLDSFARLAPSRGARPLYSERLCYWQSRGQGPSQSLVPKHLTSKAANPRKQRPRMKYGLKLGTNYGATMLIGLILALARPTLPAQAAPPAKPPAKQPARQPVTLDSQESVTLLKKALDAMQLKQDEAAERLLKQAAGLMSPSNPNWLFLHDSLAKIYYRQSQAAKALPHAQKTLPLLANRYGQNSLEMADGLAFVARLYADLPNPTQAESFYKQALALYESPANAHKSAGGYAVALHNLGALSSQQKNYPAALATFQKALALQEAQQGEDIGIISENIAICYHHLNQINEAIRYYQKALTHYESTLGQNHPTTQKLSFQLASLRAANAPRESAAKAPASTNGYNGRFYEAGKKAYNDAKNYEEAAAQFKLALAQVLKFYPNQADFIANIKSALGKALFLSEDDESATPYLESALAYQSKKLGPGDPTVLDTQLFLALAYSRQSEYEMVEKVLHTVLAHSPKGAELSPHLLPLLAENLCHQGRFEEAKALYTQALAHYQKQATPDARQIEVIQYQLALLDKMFKSQNLGLEQYFKHSVTGLRRWNDDNKIIYVFLENGENLPGWNPKYPTLVQRAFTEWQKALGNRHQFQLVTDLEKSDVLFKWSDKPLAESNVDAQVGVHQIESIHGTFLKSDIILALNKNGHARTEHDIYATALHEIGHLLGLGHSGNLADIMAEVGNYAYSEKDWPTLSSRDIQAAQLLYQQKPAITNPKGITVAEYRKFNSITQEGVEALQRRNYRQAYRVLSEARQLYQDDPYINFYCGVSAFQKGDYKEAREIFENLEMPETAKVFSVDSQLGLIYVELGHKYNKWGRKNKALSHEFYAKGVHHLQLALQNPELALNQKEYLFEKLREGQNRKKPEPVFYFDSKFPAGRFF